MKTLNEKIALHVSRRTLILFALLYVAMLLTMFFIPGGVRDLASLSGTSLPDLRPQYNISYITTFFSGADEAFIKDYRNIHLLDIPYALSYTLFLIAWMYQSRAYQKIAWGALFPLLAFVFDMLENKFLMDCYTQLHEINEGMVAMASTFTTLKWISIFAALFVIAYGWLTRKNYSHQHEEKTSAEMHEEENLT